MSVHLTLWKAVEGYLLEAQARQLSPNTLLASTRDTLTLYCEGCGSVYRVSRRRADEGRLNWFACPGGKHGRTQD